MDTMMLFLADLSDQDLLARTMQLAADERQATALLIAHLAELDARRLYLAEGYSSLFTYCTEVLRLSEHAAYGRIEAARTARRFPLVLEMLGEGSVTLTTVGLLAPHLTAENHRDLLDRARQKSKRAVEELIAGLAPRPPVPAVVRRLPGARWLHPPPRYPGGRRRWPRWRRSATKCSSRRGRRRMRSCGWRKTCCATRFRTAIWIRFSIGP